MNGIAVVGAVLLLLVLIILGPYLLLWALNVIFFLGLTYTFTQWCAAFVLLLLLGRGR